MISLKELMNESKPDVPSPEDVAMFFHETYERLAPEFSYKTRKASAVEWDDVPENNKQLMIAVASEVIKRFIRGS